jgi:lysophospholipase L1-like esterase
VTSPSGSSSPHGASGSSSQEASGSSSPRSAPDRAFRGARTLLSPSAIAMVTVAALVGLPYLVPGVQRLRLLTPLPETASLFAMPAPAQPAATVGAAKLEAETKDDDALKQPEVVELPAAAREIVPPPTAEQKPPRSIEDPTAKALDPYFRKLMAVERKDAKAIARAMYFGDSIVATDYVTGTLRRRLMKRFGDAGHGFMPMANPWPGYFHNDVSRYAGPGWHVSRVVGPYSKDSLYGLGGTSFRTEGPGLFSTFGTAKDGSFGRTAARFVVAYLEQPDGGKMEIAVDGQPREVIDTRADETKSAWKTYEVPPGAHELKVTPLERNVRAFGVWMENDGPGAVLDAVGIQGGHLRQLDANDDAHWAEQLRRRDPSLVVFAYGINEVADGEAFPIPQFIDTGLPVLRQVRAALPDAACLVIGPLDRATKQSDGYGASAFVPKLAAAQRRIAHDAGCGYFDTFGAMGGSGAMGIWVQRGLGQSDLAHPSGAGSEVIGNWIYLALMEAYDAFKVREASKNAAPAPTATGN